MMKFKRGDDFALEIRRDPAVDLTDLRIVSRLRGRSGEIELQVRRIDDLAGIFQVFAPAEITRTWSPGIYQWDVKYIGRTVDVWPRTGNLLIEITESPTYAAY